MNMIAPRDAYGEGLVSIGEEMPEVVVLDADVSKASKTTIFQAKFPERFFNLGISESDLVGTGAGFAVAGKVPFVNAYANFLIGNGWEQIRISICYANKNVKLVGHNAGASPGKDGPTHLPFEDIALMRALPGMTVVEPADGVEMVKAVRAIAIHKGPAYLRVGRVSTPVVTSSKDPFIIGKANLCRLGTDVTIIASGVMVSKGLKAAILLEREGISAEVINSHTIKPLDEETILTSARKTKAVVTAEEHTIIGGLGSAVAELCSQNEPLPLKMIGVMDRFGECGTYDELHTILGLTEEDIVIAVKEVLRKKKF